VLGIHRLLLPVEGDQFMPQRLSYYSFYFKEFMLKSHYKFMDKAAYRLFRRWRRLQKGFDVLEQGGDLPVVQHRVSQPAASRDHHELRRSEA
jgi:hypothetical protein